MKKILSVLIIVFAGLILHAGNWNPYVSNGTVTPAPLLPWQFNGAGELFFKVGNTGNDPLPYDPNPLPNNNVILKITLSSGVPNAVNALDALGGTWKTKFTWSWNAGTNTYTGYQNVDILGQSEGNITIQYKVTVNTTISSPSNGFNVNLTPPPYTNGVNATGDDAVSSYTFTQALDYGDAPASYGAASHEISFTTYLGATIDNETANQPSANALGDDITGIDDEDGVTIPTLIRGASGNISVAAVITGLGVLNVWIDWDGNGDFTGAGEKIATDQLIFASGPVLVPYSVPTGAYITAATFARFRITPITSGYPSNLSPTGYILGGEVEDYMVQIYNKADLGVTKTDGTNFFAPGANNVYTVVVTNNGPNSMTGATVTDLTPPGTTITGWTAVFSGGAGSSGNTSGSGSINELINLAYPGSVTYTITVAVPCEYAGDLVNTASVAVPFNVIDDTPGNNSQTDTDTQNTWTGALGNDWNTAGNWTQGVPNCNTIGAVIPDVTNDPVINTTGNFAANLTILSGGLLTINPGKELKVCRCTQINQTDGLYLKSDATGNAKFIDNGITYANNGSAKVELYLTTCVGETDKFRCWHYVTSPVIDAVAGVFVNDYMKSYDEPLGAWSPYYTHLGDPMNELQGYAVNAQGSGVRTFHGQLLTGNQTTSPALTRTVNLGWGWNLVGNPYASPIDINSGGITWNNVDAWVYYLDRAAGNYKAWPTANPYGYGTGTQYPLSMQGFFVHVTEGQTSGTISFTNAARTFTSDHIFYKNSFQDLLWLKAEGSTTGLNDEIIVCFNPEATNNTDASVDAVKLTGDKEAPQFYSVTPDQSHLTVNTMPFAGINTVVPLDFYVESKGTGNYSITASNMETFRAGTRMTLEDKKTNTNQVLSENPVYNFSYTEGESSSRFLLHFYNPYFGIDEKKISQELAIYSYDNNIYVKDLTGMELKGRMVVYNLVGQNVATRTLTGGTLNKFSMNIEEGYYVVEVFDNDKVYHGKVYLTR